MSVGKRHSPARNLGHHVSLLVSVIALALAFFVVPAHAEECTSSGCVQYDPSVPKAEGEHTPTHHASKTPAKASKTGNGGGSGSPQAPGSQESEGSEEGESSEKEGVVAGGNSGGNGQGKAGGSAKGGAKQAVHPGAQSGPATQTSQPDSGGGSSPLVPILIAIAVLAAISVAVVMMRQRRQRRGPTATASPEAN